MAKFVSISLYMNKGNLFIIIDFILISDLLLAQAVSTPVSSQASSADLSSLSSPAKRPRIEADPDYRLEETGSSAYNDR